MQRRSLYCIPEGPGISDTFIDIVTRDNERCKSTVVADYVMNQHFQTTGPTISGARLALACRTIVLTEPGVFGSFIEEMILERLAREAVADMVTDIDGSVINRQTLQLISKHAPQHNKKAVNKKIATILAKSEIREKLQKLGLALVVNTDTTSLPHVMTMVNMILNVFRVRKNPVVGSDLLSSLTMMCSAVNIFQGPCLHCFIGPLSHVEKGNAVLPLLDEDYRRLNYISRVCKTDEKEMIALVESVKFQGGSLANWCTRCNTSKFRSLRFLDALVNLRASPRTIGAFCG